MKRNLLLVLSFLVAIGAALSGCAKKESTDKVVTISDDDTEMASAIAKARDTLPQFWAVFAKPQNGESDFTLKVKITDRHGVEHFWAVDIERRDGKVFGTIDNDPNVVKSVKLGDRIEIPEADITDWGYMRGGKMVGNETLRPLLKTMPPEQAQELKQLLADP